ncbi:hypothetical protein [Sinomicrobium sp. M5D2P17]
MDLVLACLIFLCYFFQVKGYMIISALFLSMGIFFKLIPIVLLPIWLLGWLPGMIRKDLKGNLKLLSYLARPMASLFIFCFLFFALSLFNFGTKAFSFLNYHDSRGIQIESTYSTIIQLFHWFGMDYRLETSFGSQNIISSVSPFFSLISPILILFGTLYAIYKITYIKNFDVSIKEKILRETAPYWLGGGYLLSLMAMLIFSKVLSTQFLLLVMPFFSLLLPGKKWGLTLIWGFALVLTVLIFPYLYVSDIINISNHTLGKTTVFGTALLFFRNASLVFLFIYWCNRFRPLSTESDYFTWKIWDDPFNYFSGISVILISTVLLFLNLLD